MYYTYTLIDPRDELPFYVGKGKVFMGKTNIIFIWNKHNEFPIFSWSSC